MWYQPVSLLLFLAMCQRPNNFSLKLVKGVSNEEYYSVK